MLTLFINTASSIESVALFDGKKLISEITWHANADESKRLLPTIFKLLRSKKKTFSDLTRIVVDSGPGSFSALRIGVTVANTLAYALKIPLYEKTTGSAKMKKRAHSASAQAERASGFASTSEAELIKKVQIAKPRYAIPPNITKPKASYVS